MFNAAEWHSQKKNQKAFIFQRFIDLKVYASCLTESDAKLIYISVKGSFGLLGSYVKMLNKHVKCVYSVVFFPINQRV